MLFVRPVARPTLAPLSGANHVLDIIRSVPHFAGRTNGHARAGL
jgi:hypothetical protein